MPRLLLVFGLLAFPLLLGAQDAPQPPASAASRTALPLKHTPLPTASAITSEDLLTRLYVFADDSMMGREAGTLGSVKATAYLAAEAKRIGLLPAGDNGTYFQTLPLKQRRVDPLSTFIAGGASLALGRDWAIGGQSSLNSANLVAVYGGVYGDTDQRLSADQAAGKLVILSVPRSNAAVNDAATSETSPVPSTAAAVALLMPPETMPQLAHYMHAPNVTLLNGALAPLRIFLNAGAATQLFVKPLSALGVGDQGATIAVNAVVSMTESEFAARNVVGILPGSDPQLAREYVALGAHSDHVGMSAEVFDHDSMLVLNRLVRPGGAEDEGKDATPQQVAQLNAELAALRAQAPSRADSTFNGADDDGSGSVAVLEIAEELASRKTAPKRSTLFVWHVGEEKGLWGSHYFTAHPTVPRDAIVAQLNMDMVGRGARSDLTGVSKDGADLHGGPDYLQVVGSRRLSSELGDIVEQVNRSGQHRFAFDYAMDANGHPMNIYCRSDHYEYAKFGIPVAFVTTGGHASYHQVTDEPQYIDYPHLTRVAKLMSDIAVELGNRTKRPRVDKRVPDPAAACQQ